MKFSTKAIALEQARTDCLVVFVYVDGALSKAAQLLDKASKGAIEKAVRRGDTNGKPGSTVMLHDVPGVTATRVLVAGAGKREEWGAKNFVAALRGAYKAILPTSAKSVSIASTDKLTDRDGGWAVRQAVLLAHEATYSFTQLKSEKPHDPPVVSSIELLADKGEEAIVKAALADGHAMGHGVDLAKTLGNLPGNHCTPSYLADTAKALGKEYKFTVQVFDRKKIEQLGMGSFLSVTNGTAEPPRFIVMEYLNGPSKQAPIVLVGKGITFDSGGISLKPGEAMDEMKFDMSGAGSVLGTFKALGELKLKLNVVGLIPTCENMPSGTATKPGDIVESMSGQTIEVLNTDAEGRLILADALTYAERYKPAAVIDMATLTGACVVALGHVNTGLFSTSDKLAAELDAAGKTMLDPAWRMPLNEEYQEQLKSNFADMANIGGRAGGAVTAACFLARFTKKYEWAHLDIAGTAWKSGAAKGSTGRPVPLLVEFLRARAKS